jgi:hypothetical protein
VFDPLTYSCGKIQYRLRRIIWAYIIWNKTTLGSTNGNLISSVFWDTHLMFVDNNRIIALGNIRIGGCSGNYSTVSIPFKKQD